MPLTRRVPSHYEDGVYQPSGATRPNPLTLSQELMKGDFGEYPDNGTETKSALLVFFGEYLTERISVSVKTFHSIYTGQLYQF